MTDICAQSTNTMQNIRARLSEYLFRRMTEETFCRTIPKANLTGLPDSEDRISSIVEKGEQFRIEHIHILERLKATSAPRREIALSHSNPPQQNQEACSDQEFARAANAMGSDTFRTLCQAAPCA